MFFELAIVGPVVTRGLSMGQQCIACRQAREWHSWRCTGFGPGCLGYGLNPRGTPTGQVTPRRQGRGGQAALEPA